MASPLDSAQFVRLLDKRLRDVSESAKLYAETKDMIPTLFNMISSDSAWEEFYSIGSVPDIPEFNGRLTSLGIAPGYHTKIEHKEYGAYIAAERKLIDDKQYNVLDDRAGGLMKSAMRVREKQGVRVFTNAQTGAFDFMTSEENVALCSDSHTTKSGTATTTGFDNAGTSVMNKSSVEATRILMRGFRNDISERVGIGDNIGLLVPDNLADKAMEIVETQKSLDQAEGNVNVNYRRYRIMVWPRLDDTDTNDWSMIDIDRMKRDLLWMDRISPESKNTVDFMTYMLMQAIYFRCSTGFRDWRWIYNHKVS